MKNKISCHKGFTLIELLVVVLIIGILASVALPQYQKAVQKSRLAQLDTMIDAARKNVELYLLANGHPSSGLVKLTGRNSVSDFNMPGDCSHENYCILGDENDIFVEVYPDYVEILVHWERRSMRFRLVRPANTREWHVDDAAHVNQGICQWFRDRHYSGSSQVVADCAEVGISVSAHAG